MEPKEGALAALANAGPAVALSGTAPRVTKDAVEILFSKWSGGCAAQCQPIVQVIEIIQMGQKGRKGRLMAVVSDGSRCAEEMFVSASVRVTDRTKRSK